MKSKTKSIKPANAKTSFTACRPSDASGSRQRLHMAIWQHLSNALLLLLSVGVGFGTATAEAQIRAYVSNLHDSTISIIDTATNSVVATTNITAGVEGSAIAFTPDGSRAYITKGVDTVSVMETATNTVVATIQVGEGPIWIAITPDGTRAYVADFDQDVEVIDTATNTVVANIFGFGISAPYRIAITPDGSLGVRPRIAF